MVDVSRIHQGSCASIFKSLPAWEVLLLLCVCRASSWSLRGRWMFLRGVLVGFEMVDVPRIHPGTCVSIFKFLPAREILHLLCVSRASSRSLRGRWRFLTGVLVVFNMVDVSRIHQGSYISIFISPPSWEVLRLLCVCRASSWSLRGCWMFLTGVLVVFDMVDAPKIYQGSYISIFKSLPSWEVFHLLCVSRASSWSLTGRCMFLRGVLVGFEMVDVPRIYPGSCLSIFKFLPAREILTLLCVSRASSWSLRGRWMFLRGVLVGFEMVDVPRIYPGSCVSIFKFLPAREILHLLCVSRASSWSLRGRWRFLTGVSVVFNMVDVSRIHQGNSISNICLSGKCSISYVSPERHHGV